MERLALAFIVTLATVVPATLVLFGDRLGLGRSYDLRPPAAESTATGGPDPVRQARVRMYLSEARDLLGDPDRRAHGCRLLRRAQQAASTEARRLYRARCSD